MTVVVKRPDPPLHYSAQYTCPSHNYYQGMDLRLLFHIDTWNAKAGISLLPRQALTACDQRLELSVVFNDGAFIS